MISLKASKFLVECDEDYNHHIFVRTSHGYDEITNGNYNKDELINDLVYAVSELVKERDKKQYSIIEQIRAEIDKIYESEGNSVDCLNALDELKEFIDKYKSESENS